MKRILALAYLGFMLFSLSSTAENAISIGRINARDSVEIKSLCLLTSIFVAIFS